MAHNLHKNNCLNCLNQKNMAGNGELCLGLREKCIEICVYSGYKVDQEVRLFQVTLQSYKIGGCSFDLSLKAPTIRKQNHSK